MTTLTGYDAIEYAEAHDVTLNKYADPTEGERHDVTVEEAREIAREDAGLLYVTTDDPEHDRYTIHAIADADLTDIHEDEIMASAATIDDAKQLASDLSAGNVYGVAIRDNETGLIDYGFGFGVPVPEPDVE